MQYPTYSVSTLGSEHAEQRRSFTGSKRLAREGISVKESIE
jgi:hypothetical protein